MVGGTVRRDREKVGLENAKRDVYYELRIYDVVGNEDSPKIGFSNRRVNPKRKTLEW